MPPRQRPNATRATTGVSNQTAASPGCSIATRTQPHTATADTSRSYVSHLTENGVDRRFIQCQVGHEVDSSTAVYTHVSGDFLNTALRKALAPALGTGSAGEQRP
jgi:site-specific recombinase XerD